QGEGQQGEREEVADADDGEPRPAAVDAGAQGEGGGDLGEDRAREEQPAHQASAASVARWEPTWTSRTPRMLRTIPAAMRSVTGSPKITADSTAVSATPVAPQMP